MNDLTEFLLARLQDCLDNAARRVLVDPLVCPVCAESVETYITPATIRGRRPNYPDRVEPCGHELTLEQAEACHRTVYLARVLAEVEAWRKIIEIHRPRYAVLYHEADRLLADAFDSLTMPTVAHTGPIWPTPESEETLRALASVYASHVDFDPRWAL